MGVQLADKNFLKEFLEKYNGVVKSDYRDNPVLKKISFREDGEIYNLNAYSAVLAVNLLEKEKGVRVLYNLSLVLGGEKSPNEYLVKKLMQQIKENKYEFHNSTLVFHLSDLEAILDKKAPEGVGFKIKENVIPVCSPQLRSEHNKKRFEYLDGQGMPIFDENGTKTLYVRNGGLLKLCPSKDGDLCCWDDLLTKPDDNSKLVVFKD